MSFKLQAINVLLTYAQCPEPKEDLFNHLLSLNTLEFVLVAQEKHKDGNNHLHAYVKFCSKPCVRNPRYFDWKGHHPNIASRPKLTAINYCTKHDTEPVANFNWKKKTKLDEAYEKILEGRANGESNDELFRIAIETDRSLLRCAPAIGYFINRLGKEVRLLQPRFNFQTFSLSPVDKTYMEQWIHVCGSMEAGDRMASKSLWFTGPTMNGKSSLACSLGPHWYMQANWNLSNIADVANTYGVLDDIEWDVLSRNYKSILGRQVMVDLTDKYKHKKSYTLGFPVIILTNELPEFTEAQKEWLRGNVDFFSLDNPVLPNNMCKPFRKIYI